MLISHISVVIIAKNSEDTLEECLEALKSFEDVVLYINDSSDNTEAIASRYVNVNIIKGIFTGFGNTKNEAAKYAKNQWILSLDSDEVLNNAIIEEIRAQKYDKKENLFILRRDNYFLGAKTISKDDIIRIYHTHYTKFDDNLVHEKIIVPSNSHVIKLLHTFKHHNITDINQTLSKMIKYTDLGAEGKKTCFFLVVIAKATFAFIQTYILRFYFLNGWRGFVIAVSNANRRFYKYLKQFINCKKEKDLRV